MWQIPKILKILISVLVAVSMALTPFAGMGFNVRSEAVSEGLILGGLFVEVLYLIADWAFQNNAENWQNILYQQQEDYMELCEKTRQVVLLSNLEDSQYIDGLVTYRYDPMDDVTYSFTEFALDETAASVLSDEQYSFYSKLVNRLNEENVALVYNSLTGGFDISSKNYEALKNVVMEEVANEFAEKAVSDLQVALGDNYAGPAYNFDFVGPTPTLELPMLNSYGSYDDGGFFFSQPITVTNYDGSTLIKLTEEQCAALSCVGQTSYKANSSGQYFFTYAKNCYGGSPYVLYDGKIFYAPTASAGSSVGNYSCSLTEQFSSLGSFKAVDGSTLADYGLTKEWLQAGTNTLQIGYILNLSNNTNYDSPLEAYQAGTMSAVTGDSFSKTTGGAVSIPHTMAEQIIGQAEKLGLLNSDSLLSLDSTGEIAAADDITIAKLQELCQLMADGNLQFESVQEYLDLITKLVSSGNVTAKAQETILSNVEKYAKTQAKDVAEIKAAVKSLTEIKEFEMSDIAVPEIGEVTFSGLTDAEVLIENSLPIVRQSVHLINNLFNWNGNVSKPPNFAFYWDSNKDGTDERYVWLDLSFMETKLTNSNLEDKERFSNPMTVRDFLQSLMVLIVYAVFAIKLLKRIPALFGSGEIGGEIDTSVKVSDVVGRATIGGQKY